MANQIYYDEISPSWTIEERSNDYRYNRAIAYKKILQRNGIRVGKQVDVHDSLYGWRGPYLCLQILKGGRVQLQGRSGQFSPYRVRLHIP